MVSNNILIILLRLWQSYPLQLPVVVFVAQNMVYVTANTVVLTQFMQLVASCTHTGKGRVLLQVNSLLFFLKLH